MFNKSLYKKYFISAFLGIFIVNLSVTGLLYFFLIEKGKTNIYKTYINSAQINFAKTNNYLETKITHFKNTLLSIDQSHVFKDYLNNNYKEDILNIFKILLQSNENLFQIRYIDKDGMEQLRVDKSNNGNIQEISILQNKKSRYYFTKTITLNNDQFYISNLDLNIEYGKIEIPFKPTIRVSKPIYNKDKLLGILIINYNAQHIINSIKIKELFDVYLIDEQDNFFLHPDLKKNYSSQLKTDYKVKDEIANINQLKNNTDIIDNNSKYYISKITQTDKDFYIIYSLKDHIYNNMNKEIQKEVLPVFIIVFLLTLPLIIYALNQQASQAMVLESIIDNIPFPIFLKNTKDKIIIVNESLIALLEKNNKEDIIGKNIQDIMENSPSSELFSTTKKLHNKDYFEDEITVYTRKGKQYIYDMKLIKLSIFGIFKRIYILGIAVDITALKSMNLQLKSLVDKEVNKRMELETTVMQQSKMADMGNMLGNIIHQWKQPLNAISLLASSGIFRLERGDLDIVELKNTYSDIVEQVTFMNETSNDFRDFFAPDKEKKDIQIQNVLKKIERVLSHRIKILNVKIIKSIDETATFYGYENELGQVVLSILNNAIDKFEAHNPDNTIYITVLKENDKNIIKIADNGGIIPMDLLPSKLFGKYFTTKKDGTGLGLSICKRIIENSFKNGRINAYNEENKATFRISIES